MRGLARLGGSLAVSIVTPTRWQLVDQAAVRIKNIMKQAWHHATTNQPPWMESVPKLCLGARFSVDLEDWRFRFFVD